MYLEKLVDGAEWARHSRQETGRRGRMSSSRPEPFDNDPNATDKWFHGDRTLVLPRQGTAAPVVREFDDWRRLAPRRRGPVATGSRRSSPTKAARSSADDWHAVGSHRGWRGQAELHDLAGEGGVEQPVRGGADAVVRER